MKSPSPQGRTTHPAGLTLIELTVVILVLLSLVGTLMFGARAWTRGSDRAACVMSICDVQKAVRAYQNFYGFAPGTYPAAQDGTQSIIEHLNSKGYLNPQLYERAKGNEPCQGGGIYSIDKEDVFPPVGVLYLHCSLEGIQRHVPTEHLQW